MSVKYKAMYSRQHLYVQIKTRPNTISPNNIFYKINNLYGIDKHGPTRVT